MALQPRVKRLLRRAAIALAALIAVWMVTVWMVFRSMPGSEKRCGDHDEFVRADWMDTTVARGKLAVRGCMIDDFLDRNDLRGKTRAEVVALIGEPDKTDYFKEYDLVYWLGPERGFVGIDSEWLVIKLDSSGRVLSAELVTD